MTTTAGWYHCSVKPIGRGAGRSVVAAAAYRTGEKLHDDRTQLTHDYTRRQGVEASFIIAPDHAPDWASDIEKLWNAAESAETRINSRTAREVELALPSSVSPEARQQIAFDLATDLSERYGVAVMVALHDPSGHGDNRNHHAHILFTTRRIGTDGFGDKTRELDDLKTGKLEILHIRETAADLINAALENAGSDERIDHRSHKDRGLEQVPSERLSLQQIAKERKGRHSKAGDRNREIKATNDTIAALVEERDGLDRQILESNQETEPGQNPEPTGEPIQESGNYWQDKLNVERQGDNEGGTPPAVPPSFEPQETPNANSIFNDSITEKFVRQIKEHGEIQHHGLGMSWADYVAHWVHELGEGIVNTVKTSLDNNWREYIKERERQQPSDPDKDGADFDR
jgi:hypothetical protein